MVGDIMFIETNKNMKKPSMIHVDVHSKFLIGVPLTDRNEKSCTDAVMQIKALYTRNNNVLKQLVFDRARDGTVRGYPIKQRYRSETKSSRPEGGTPRSVDYIDKRKSQSN